MLTGSPGTPLFNVTGTWVDPGANSSVYIRKYDGPDRSVDEIRLGTRLPPVVIGRWLQLLVIALIHTLRFQASCQPRDGLPERMPGMLPSDTSAEAAEVQRTRIRELPPLERLRKGCSLSNRRRPRQQLRVRVVCRQRHRLRRHRRWAEHRCGACARAVNVGDGFGRNRLCGLAGVSAPQTDRVGGPDWSTLTGQRGLSFCAGSNAMVGWCTSTATRSFTGFGNWPIR